MSLLTKFVEENKDLDLKDQTIMAGIVYTVDVNGHVYKAQKESADFLRLVKIIECDFDSENAMVNEKSEAGPFIRSLNGHLVVYGPQPVIKKFKKSSSGWTLDSYVTLTAPLTHIIDVPSMDCLIAWDVHEGLVQITDTVTVLKESRSCPRKILAVELIHPDDEFLVTLNDNAALNFWTVDEGIFISNLALKCRAEKMICHPFVPYLVVMSSNHGDLLIINVGNVRRPRIYIAISLSFYPLANVVFNFSGAWILSVAHDYEKVFLSSGNPALEFKTRSCVLCRYKFSYLTTMRGSSDREWLVLLLSSYKNSYNRYIQLLFIPDMSETGIIDLEDSYSSLHCCPHFALLLLGVKHYDVKVHELTIDQSRSILANKVVKPVNHMFPPIKIYIDFFHYITFGLNDGCMALYSSEVGPVKNFTAPHKFNGIAQAIVTRPADFIIVLTKRNADLVCYRNEVPCDHTEKQHKPQSVPYEPLQHCHGDFFKTTITEAVPWEDREEKVMIVHRVGTKVVDRKIVPKVLIQLLNTESKENKIRALKDVGDQFDPNIVVDYIYKWLTYYRFYAEKFIEWNTSLETTNTLEFIPWDVIKKKVEKRAYKEYNQRFERDLAWFKQKISKQEALWKDRYNNIIEYTWKKMAVPPRKLKMIFRKFATPDFGFFENRKSTYLKLNELIQLSHSDSLIHPLSQNLLWDARFDIHDGYWSEYYTYLTGEVETSDEEDTPVHEEEITEYDFNNVLNPNFMDDDDISGSERDLPVFTNMTEGLKSQVQLRKVRSEMVSPVTQSKSPLRIAMSMASRSKMLRQQSDVQPEPSLEEWQTKVEARVESDESLFYDSEEDAITDEKVKKRYVERKQKVLKELFYEYPYLDEMPIDLFHRMVRFPNGLPEECILRAPLGIPIQDLEEEPGGEVPVHSIPAVGIYPSAIDLYNVNEPINLNIEVDPDVPLTDPSGDRKVVFHSTDKEEAKKSDDSDMSPRLEIIPPSDRIIIAREKLKREREATVVTPPQSPRKKGKKMHKRSPKKIKVEPEIKDEPKVVEVELGNREQNIQRRIVKYLPEKSTDQLKINTIREEDMSSMPLKPKQLIARKDIDRLNALLNVEILLEANKRKRKRRKSSLQREQYEMFKQIEASKKNDKISDVLSTEGTILTALTDTTGKDILSNYYEIESSSDESVISRKPELVKDRLEIRRVASDYKAMLIGDVKEFKKRRILLGRKDPSKRDPMIAEEQRQKDLVEFGLGGERLEADAVNKLRTRMEAIFSADDADESIPPVTQEEIDDLCWYESAKKEIEDEKKLTAAAEKANLEEESSSFFELPKMKSKVSLASIAIKPKKDKKKEYVPPRLHALEGINTVEEGMSFLLAGSTPHLYVAVDPLRPIQLATSSMLSITTESAHDQKVLYDIMSFFNIQFNNLRKIKETVINSITRHQKDYYFYLKEIELACKEFHVFPNMPPVKWDPCEDSINMISVSDGEIPVQKYFSPSELSLIRKQEEEELLKGMNIPKQNPFRLSALLSMMDGVVEKRWEDELKRDAPYPKRLIDKQLSEYDEDDLIALKRYEEEVEQLRQERLRYRDILFEQIRAVVENIRNVQISFDSRLKQLHEKHLEFRHIVNQEKLKIMKKYLDKVTVTSFLQVIEDARKFNEATQASMDEIEELLQALQRRLKLEINKITSLARKKLGREDKLDETLKKLGMIPVDRANVITNYIRPPLVIHNKYVEHPYILDTALFLWHDPEFAADPLLIEFFKEINHAMKRNIPQKFTKLIWDILTSMRREHIKFDVKIKVLEKEVRRAEDTMKFFKAYLKQKQTFTDMISKAMEASVRRFRMAHYLKEYQLVVPLGMLEIKVGWEENADTPVSTDLLLIPSKHYEDLLNDKYNADLTFKYEQWLKEFHNHEISKLMLKHYDHIIKQKEIALLVKHIDRFQPSQHSRNLIRFIKETGTQLQSKGTKHTMEGSIQDEEVLVIPTAKVKREAVESKVIMDDQAEGKDPDSYFPDGSEIAVKEEYDSSSGGSSDEYPRVGSDPPLNLSEMHYYDMANIDARDDIFKAPPIQFLFTQFKPVKREEDIEDESSERSESYSVRAPPFPQFGQEGSLLSMISAFGKDVISSKMSTIDFGVSSESLESAKKTYKITLQKRKEIFRDKMRSIKAKHKFSQIRALKLDLHYKIVQTEILRDYNNIMSIVGEIIRAYKLRGNQGYRKLILPKVNLPLLLRPSLVRDPSVFTEFKYKYFMNMGRNIRKNIALFFPSVEPCEKGIFLKTKPINWTKLADQAMHIKEDYQYQPPPETLAKIKAAIRAKMSTEITRAITAQEQLINSLMKRKQEFAFTGEWEAKLVELWQELNRVKAMPKRLKEEIDLSHLGSVDYWDFSEFNFKRQMRKNLNSLLKNYQALVSKYAAEYKKIEKEMSRYIEMNTKCVVLFFKYELSLSKADPSKKEINQLTEECGEFYATRKLKVRKAVQKARLLREIQKNQTDILMLQSQLELIHLKTYPIMFKKYDCE